MTQPKNFRTLLVYDIPRLARNRWFVEALREKFAQVGLSLELQLRENLRPEDFEPPQLPDAVLMRCAAPDVSLRFESLGVRVFNSAHVSEIGNDKLKTLQFVSQLGVPVMESYAFQNTLSDALPLPFPFVLKTLDGHGGSEVFLVENSTQLAHLYNPAKKWLIQRLCDTPGRDVRVYVVGNRVVAAMERRSLTDFRSNYSLGGTAVPYTLNAEEKGIVSTILGALPLDFAGIDLIFDHGRPFLNEIEDVVGSRMLYEKTNLDVLDLFMAHFLTVSPHFGFPLTSENVSKYWSASRE